MSPKAVLALSAVGFGSLFVACGTDDPGPGRGLGGTAGWQTARGGAGGTHLGVGGAAGTSSGMAGAAGAGTAGAPAGGAAGSAAGNGAGGQAGNAGAAGGAGGSGTAGAGGAGGQGPGGAAGHASGGSAGSSVGGAAGSSSSGNGGAAGHGPGGTGTGSAGAAGVAGSGAGGSAGSSGGAGGTSTYGPLTCGAHSVVADFDGDGTPDCVTTVANSALPLIQGMYAPAGNYTLFFLKGLGAGSYSQTGIFVDYIYSSAGGPSTIGDMNGDGRADLLVTDYTSSNIGNTDVTVTYLKGQTDGTFVGGGYASFHGQSGLSILGGNGVVGDFNNDGHPDLLGAWWTYGDNSQAVYLMLVSDKGCTTVPAGFFIGAHGKLDLATTPADFNTDGNLDLVASVHTVTLTATVNTANVQIAYGNGDGTFGSAVTVPGTSGADGVSVSDLNGDGKADLDVSLSSLTPFYGDGAGNFSTTPP